MITELLVGDLSNNAIFHPISWISHKSKRPVRIVLTAEIIASEEAIDVAKSIANE